MFFVLFSILTFFLLYFFFVLFVILTRFLEYMFFIFFSILTLVIFTWSARFREFVMRFIASYTQHLCLSF
ncbi:hypothetical protein NY2A_b804L [Paramecium bursaria Chlorella virus NY2A]|uniref:Uncharacterized protein b804L n=1 Tax=Paramecium bursaria Chlorella virus NY2A TaxID=46021 RepID=A7IXX9_PBCVN|nr:hypothetical protein NY2A_b804L [Paramecium bursaria Chlorella virus NY2A]ABT15203.1 hypothetical protein NY2A_b804L [Paramecium bursaria Chlorella virus NY2A]